MIERACRLWLLTLFSRKDWEQNFFCCLYKEISPADPYGNITEELGYQAFEETESSGLDETGREMKKKQ